MSPSYYRSFNATVAELKNFDSKTPSKARKRIRAFHAAMLAASVNSRGKFWWT